MLSSEWGCLTPPPLRFAGVFFDGQFKKRLIQIYQYWISILIGETLRKGAYQ